MYQSKICIIGSKGYIGSVLAKEFSNISVCYDGRIPSSTGNGYMTGNNYDPKFIQSFEKIIYLGGISPRQMSFDDIDQNTNDILSLAKLMTENQQLIYASTSKIYLNLTNASETTPIEESALNAYSLSMLQREQLLSALTNVNTIGLRLASVVGISPKLRSDGLHIQMLKSALFTGIIYVKSPLSLRPVLSMSDMISAFQHILMFPNSRGHKIYNLSSFNTTITAIATSIALKTNAKVISESNKQGMSFSIDSSAFIDDFHYSPQSTNDSIIDELIQKQQELISIWLPEIKTQSTRCFCCDNSEMMELINLGTQPLANNFLKHCCKKISSLCLPL